MVSARLQLGSCCNTVACRRHCIWRNYKKRMSYYRWTLCCLLSCCRLPQHAHCGYYWNILEPPATGTYTTLYDPSWIVLDVPCPQYLKCIAALMCSYPPLSYNTLTCSGVLWGVLACVAFSLLYWILVEHIGTSWNRLEHIPPVPEMHSCTDV